MIIRGFLQRLINRNHDKMEEQIIMTKKRIFFLTFMFLVTFSLFFAVSDAMAESVSITTIGSNTENNVAIIESLDFLADDISSEDVIDEEESEDEEEVAEEPDEDTEEVDEGSDEEIEEDTGEESDEDQEEGEEYPDYETEEEGEDF